MTGEQPQPQPQPLAGRARSPWARRGMQFGLGLIPLGGAACGAHRWLAESWTKAAVTAVSLACLGVVVQEVAERRRAGRRTAP
ncbi:hypothetical protein [Streptomyces panaciradicis]|uniref:hypothetical protein n=1 Tax=Streptomyces panaciradicis TaxID=1470261 RepID=UPI00201CEFB9|nr:hypothetical protein [Streptomyces panaciradicis]MCL6668280.1 hypothetical protein [Streptomyces panaciradicis]